MSQAIDSILGSLGPAVVSWKGTELEDNVGVEVRYSEDMAEVVTARTGTAPVDHIHIGTRLEVDVELTLTGKTQLEALLKGSEGTGTDSATTVVRSTVGESMRANCGELVIERQIGDDVSADPEDRITIFAASPKPDFTIPYNVSDQRKFKFTFMCYKLEADGEGGTGTLKGWLYKIGV